MKQFLIVLFLSWLCCLTAKEVQSQNFVDSIQLETIPSLKNVYWQTSDIVFAEGWLFVEDQKTDYRIQVYNPENGKKVYQFGRRGRGPGEYLSFSLQKGPGPDLIEVSDVGNKKNDIYDVSCLKQKPSVSLAHKCIIKTEANLASHQAMIINDDLVLNQGATTSGFLFLSRDEQKLRHLYDTPQEVKEKYKRPLHEAMSMTGRLTANPNRTKFAYFADAFDWALFFKREENKIELLNEYKFSFLPEFTVQDFGGSSMLTPAENYRAAFEHPVAGREHYFVLYSGKSSQDVKKEGGIGRSFTNRIKVFDWMGNEIKEILLSENILMLAVNYEETRLYGITFNKDFEATVITGALKN